MNLQYLLHHVWSWWRPECDWAAVGCAAQAVVEVAARLGSAVASAAAMRACLRLPHARARALCIHGIECLGFRFTPHPSHVDTES